MAHTVKVRKRPIQARSRARVEAILLAASQIISEDGSDNLKMSEVAARAQIPIGSVYQFFPNKSSIIHELAQGIMDKVRTGLILTFADFQDRDDAIRKIAKAIQDYYEFFAREAVCRDIWCSTQGDKQLQQMDIEDSRVNGSLLFEKLKPFVCKSEHKNLACTCFLNMQLTGAAIRLAVTQDKTTAKLILRQYSEMACNTIRRFPH